MPADPEPDRADGVSPTASFVAAATFSVPAAVAYSTARARTSCTTPRSSPRMHESVHGLTKKLLLVSRICRAAAHIRPQTAASGSACPRSSITFTDATRTPGATPVIP